MIIFYRIIFELLVDKINLFLNLDIFRYGSIPNKILFIIYEESAVFVVYYSSKKKYGVYIAISERLQYIFYNG